MTIQIVQVQSGFKADEKKYANSKYILKASNFGIYLTLNYSHQFVK